MKIKIQPLPSSWPEKTIDIQLFHLPAIKRTGDSAGRVVKNKGNAVPSSFTSISACNLEDDLLGPLPLNSTTTKLKHLSFSLPPTPQFITEFSDFAFAENEPTAPAPATEDRRYSQFDGDLYLQQRHFPLPYSTFTTVDSKSTSPSLEIHRKSDFSASSSESLCLPKIRGHRPSITPVRPKIKSNTGFQNRSLHARAYIVKIKSKEGHQQSDVEFMMSIEKQFNECKVLESSLDRMLNDKKKREDRIKLLALRKKERKHELLQLRIEASVK